MSARAGTGAARAAVAIRAFRKVFIGCPVFAMNGNEGAGLGNAASGACLYLDLAIPTNLVGYRDAFALSIPSTARPAGFVRARRLPAKAARCILARPFSPDTHATDPKPLHHACDRLVRYRADQPPRNRAPRRHAGHKAQREGGAAGGMAGQRHPL